MIINNEEHKSRSWKVDEIATDFDLWDVWEVPIIANNSPTENFRTFFNLMSKAFLNLHSKKDVTGMLFKLRKWLSKIIPMDKNVNTLPIPGCLEISVRNRLSDHDLASDQSGNQHADSHSGMEFQTIYLFENESLLELSNNTTHALLHTGWIKKNNKNYTATLAIYVKPRGSLGRVYLKLIEPFRRFIVYPTMMKILKTTWHQHIAAKREHLKKGD